MGTQEAWEAGAIGTVLVKGTVTESASVALMSAVDVMGLGGLNARLATPGSTGGSVAAYLEPRRNSCRAGHLTLSAYRNGGAMAAAVSAPDGTLPGRVACCELPLTAAVQPHPPIVAHEGGDVGTTRDIVTHECDQGTVGDLVATVIRSKMA